ncbi:MAG: hypothetical protein ACPGTS_00840 [Minisyncoccia bacterium]
MKNILIFNPLFSCENGIKGERKLIIEPDIEAFKEAIQLKYDNIFMVADTPPHIQSYPELFNSKRDLYKKNGINNLRILSQFNKKIVEFYGNYAENINVKT